MTSPPSGTEYCIRRVRRTIGFITFVGPIAAAIAALFVRPKVELARDSVEVALSPPELLEVFRQRFAGDADAILAAEPDRIVRRFAGTEGPFSFKTVEVVRFEDAAVTFEHLAGPFAECNERFDLQPIGAEVNGGPATLLTHSGSFRLRGGLWTVPLAFGPVKRAFEAHVRGHFENLAVEHAHRDPASGADLVGGAGQ